jgi:hypothetical protein
MGVAVFVDGSNVTEKVVEGSVSHTFNGRASATIKMPIDVAAGGDGSTLYVDPGAGERYYGEVQHVDEQGDEDTGYVVLTSVDHAFITELRPARDADGDFSNPTFMTDFPTGPQMLQEILQNSITYEGELGFSLGTFETGGATLSGLPTDWPMSIGETAGLLVQTGEVDIVMTYDSGGASLSAYNGDYGNDLSGSVQFLYAMGASSNCRGCRRTIDSTEMMNKFYLYGGPRISRPNDPDFALQHWKYLITRDEGTAANKYGVQDLPGFAAVNSLIEASRATRRVRMEVRIVDRASEEEGAASRELDRFLWLRESALRAQAKTLVHLTPHRGIAPSFGVGDRIHVQAGPSFRGGFSGTQRVFQYTYRWDEDGVVELGEPVGQAGAPALVTSADQEALS